jgi:hypothetical protein
MYPSDFSTADAVYTRIDAPVFLGLPPLLVVLVLLLLIAVGAGAYIRGRKDGRSDEGSDRTVEEIYAVILRYATVARSASSNELKQKAEDLHRKIHEYLGPVIVIGSGMGGLIKDLKVGLEGKVDDPVKPASAKDEIRSAECGCGGHGTSCKCTCGQQGREAPAHPVSINQIYIGGAAGGEHPAQAGKAPCRDTGAAKPDTDKADRASPAAKRDMSSKEQIDALDRAVRAFNDHWLARDQRVGELKAAQRALLRRPHASDTSPGPGGRFPERH